MRLNGGHRAHAIIRGLTGAQNKRRLKVAHGERGKRRGRRLRFPSTSAVTTRQPNELWTKTLVYKTIVQPTLHALCIFLKAPQIKIARAHVNFVPLHSRTHTKPGEIVVYEALYPRRKIIVPRVCFHFVLLLTYLPGRGCKVVAGGAERDYFARSREETIITHTEFTFSINCEHD